MLPKFPPFTIQQPEGSGKDINNVKLLPCPLSAKDSHLTFHKSSENSLPGQEAQHMTCRTSFLTSPCLAIPTPAALPPPSSQQSPRGLCIPELSTCRALPEGLVACALAHNSVPASPPPRSFLPTLSEETSQTLSILSSCFMHPKACN